MKVLIISPTEKGIGGIAQHVQGLSNFLKKNGHSVEIMSSENTFTIPVKGLKNPSFMISSYLKSKFKKDNDIVHAHNIPAALAMKNASGKKILSLHGIFSKQINELHGKTTSRISERYEKDALNWADAITVISNEASEHYKKLGFHVNQIPNGIDISSLPTNEEKRFENQIIFAGRLSKEKGTLVLLDIAKKIPDNINLIILGTGPEEDKVREEAKCHSNVHFLGYQSKEKTIALIRGSEILVQPSLMEGISSTILEAMACKTPVIASNVGGNKEILQNNENGILVDPNSSESILEKIVELVQDNNKKKKLAEKAFRTVKKYDWENIGNLYLGIYESLLNQTK